MPHRFLVHSGKQLSSSANVPEIAMKLAFPTQTELRPVRYGFGQFHDTAESYTVQYKSDPLSAFCGRTISTEEADSVLFLLRAFHTLAESFLIHSLFNHTSLAFLFLKIESIQAPKPLTLCRCFGLLTILFHHHAVRSGTLAIDLSTRRCDVPLQGGVIFYICFLVGINSFKYRLFCRFLRLQLPVFH